MEKTRINRMLEVNQMKPCSVFDGLVSVVIPVYKVEKYLSECIESVLKQTYGKIEILLIDDGSPDGCPKICDEYAKKYTRVRVIHKANGGLSDARNAGLALANGKYVYFLDSDDRIEPDAVEALIMEAEYCSADVVFFDSTVFGSSTGANFPKDYYVRHGLYSNPKSGVDMLGELLEFDEYRSAVPLLFIRRFLLEEQNISFYNGILHEDELFTIQLFLRSRVVVHLPEPLYNRRVRDDSIMARRKSPENFLGLLTVASGIVDDFFKYGLNKKAKKVVLTALCRILAGVNGVFHQLSFRDQVSVLGALWCFKGRLKKDRYLGSSEVRHRCATITSLAVAQRIKRRIPLEFKVKIKKLTLNFQERKPCCDTSLNELEHTGGKRRIILLGTPVHGNLGDHAIAIAERDLFKKYLPDYQVIEIVMPVYLVNVNKIKKYTSQEDIIMISGGGWLGNLWLHNEKMVRGVIGNYPDNKVVILPQTVFFENTEEGSTQKEISRKVYASHKNLMFACRDKVSFDFVINSGFLGERGECFYLPDIALALNPPIFDKDREGALLCFRTDREKSMSFKDRRLLKNILRRSGLATTYTTTVYFDDISPCQREETLNATLKEYAGAKVVITDRLHSMIFATVTGTPCIAFDNVTGKVKGVYEWIRDLKYVWCVFSVDEASAVLDSLLDMDDMVYRSDKLIEHFKIFLKNISV